LVGEGELVEQELVEFLGLGVAFHVQLPAVGGGDGDIKHLDLGEAGEHSGALSPVALA
jgi:hypothetical protein